MSFYFSGTAMMLGALVVLMEPLAMKHEQKKLSNSHPPPPVPPPPSDESRLEELANV